MSVPEDLKRFPTDEQIRALKRLGKLSEATGLDIVQGSVGPTSLPAGTAGSDLSTVPDEAPAPGRCPHALRSVGATKGSRCIHPKGHSGAHFFGSSQ